MIHLHISRERVVTKSIIDGGKNYKERERLLVTSTKIYE